MLPKKQDLIETSSEDPVRFYYAPLLGWFYKERLKISLDLIENKKKQKVLDIGYGSGILFPELSQRFELLYGCDIHSEGSRVKKIFKRQNIEIQLVRGSILNLPYRDESFDTIVCISVLEHISELDKVNSEIFRTLKHKGNLIISFPSSKLIMGILFKLTLISYKHPFKHISDENVILNSLKKFFTVKKLISFPNFMPFNLSFYFSCKCEKRYD